MILECTGDVSDETFKPGQLVMPQVRDVLRVDALEVGVELVHELDGVCHERLVMRM